MSPKPLQAAGFEWSSCVSPAVKRKRFGPRALSLSGRHPTTRPTDNGDSGSLWAERKHLRQEYKQIVVVGLADKALIYDVKSHTLSCHQSVPLFPSLSLLCPQLTNPTEILLAYDCHLKSG